MPLDIFEGVNFPDARINLKGDNPEPGQAGDPPPAQDPDPGGKVADTPAAKEPDAKPAEDTPKEGYDKDGKPLPFDQHPKWQSARKAEKFLDELIEANDFLDRDEVLEALETGKTLKEALKGHSVQDLLAAADELNNLKSEIEDNKRKTLEDDEDPDAKYQRLLQENRRLSQTLKRQEQDLADQKQSASEIQQFDSEVSRVLDAMSVPDEGDMREMLLMVMGVNNPAVEIDITDRRAVRQMVKDNATAFNTFAKKLQQQAIDDYVSGKSKLKATPGNAETTPKPKPKEKVEGLPPENPFRKFQEESNIKSVDSTMDEAKSEFYEILLEGAKAAQ